MFNLFRSVCFPVFFGAMLPLTGCFSKAADTDGEERSARPNQAKGGKVHVITILSKNEPFFSEILSNGVVHAQQKADIKFPLNYTITDIRVHNGQYVEKGELLAMLDDSIVQHKKERSRQAMEKSRVDLDDKLIDYGYRLSDSAHIPPDIMKMAKIRSGYLSAGFDYRDALEELKGTRIMAPFSGRIADLEARVYNSADVFHKLCVLIYDKILIVDFPVLESEYRLLKIGHQVEVRPFNDNGPVYKGAISTINPTIDENGMIHVTAQIDNANGYLLDGMNVHISLLTNEGDKLVVPREAILEREGRNVIFTAENGRAKWNFVTLGKQNSRFQVVLSGLKPAEKVIVTNNINLAHGTELSLDKDTVAVHH